MSERRRHPRALAAGGAVLVLAGVAAAGAWHATRDRAGPPSRLVPAGPPIVDPKSGAALVPLQDAQSKTPEGFVLRVGGGAGGKNAKGVVHLPGGGTVELKPVEPPPAPPGGGK